MVISSINMQIMKETQEMLEFFHGFILPDQIAS